MRPSESSDIILWAGKPHRWKFITRIKYSVPFFIILTVGFANPTRLAFMGKLRTTGGEIVPHIEYLLLLVMVFGLYSSLGRFVVAASDWKNTEYLITRSEVIMTYGLMSKKEKRIPIHGIVTIRIVVDISRENKKVIGSVILGKGFYYWANFAAYLSFVRKYEGVFWFSPALLYVEAPEDVATLIRSLARGEQG